MITQYNFKKNNYSDQRFAHDTIEKLTVEKDEPTLFVDGTYYSEDIDKKAKTKGIKVVPTNLVGGSKNNNGNKFEIDEKRHMIKKCPSGLKPVYNAFKKGFYRAHFNKKHYNNCPLRENCLVVKQMKNYLLGVTETKLHHSKAYR